ncbi:type II toxin-antitoxin system PemK/MazF family toxin [Cellulomonas shaoxiangyii]|uniref:Type II toxin-antitoxin system PemK/MazF family toxin n=1 Tax=Cellulomonas shaoxiangyii TaxID=2566013 RepID=A0A4P7SMM1_9CELL|nr:type II toxin-antitoxin system PemK/MazF family toxin [Cellulomonas shaoxiangyii]
MLRAVVDAVRPSTGAPARPRRPATARPGAARAGDGAQRTVRPTWAPAADGEPDPGEVVWAWVPYEDDPTQGKDRPVLVLAREGRTLVALMLSSQDHDRDAADEARHGRVWTDVGTGGWDPRGRPSEVRLDRVLRLGPEAVRREGAALDPEVFDRVTRAAARLHGW